MCARSGKKEHPASLPVFSTDTLDEAESLIQLFTCRVYAGPLAGRHVVERMCRCDTDEDALAMMSVLGEQMAEAYTRMQSRKEKKMPKFTGTVTIRLEITATVTGISAKDEDAANERLEKMLADNKFEIASWKPTKESPNIEFEEVDQTAEVDTVDEE